MQEEEETPFPFFFIFKVWMSTAGFLLESQSVHLYTLPNSNRWPFSSFTCALNRPTTGHIFQGTPTSQSSKVTFFIMVGKSHTFVPPIHHGSKKTSRCTSEEKKKKKDKPHRQALNEPIIVTDIGRLTKHKQYEFVVRTTVRMHPSKIGLPKKTEFIQTPKTEKNKTKVSFFSQVEFILKLNIIRVLIGSEGLDHHQTHGRALTWKREKQREATC